MKKTPTDLYIMPKLNNTEWNRNEIVTVHHELPTSRRGADVEKNKIMLYLSLHDAFHRVFGNWTPTEQIKRLLYINSSCLSNEFKNDIYKVLSEEDDQYYYKNGILLKR